MNPKPLSGMCGRHPRRHGGRRAGNRSPFLSPGISDLRCWAATRNAVEPRVTTSVSVYLAPQCSTCKSTRTESGVGC